MSLKRFRTMVDLVIARIDPEAARRHRERGDARRNISIRPDRRTFRPVEGHRLATRGAEPRV